MRKLILLAIMKSVAAVAALACPGGVKPPDELIGTWEAASDFEYALTLNEDCTYQIQHSEHSEPYNGEWTYSLYRTLPYMVLDLGNATTFSVLPHQASTDEGRKRALCVLLAYELEDGPGQRDFKRLHCGLIFIEK